MPAPAVAPRAPRLSRRATATAAAVVALLLAVLLSLAVGARSIPPGEVLDALLHGGNSDAAEVIRTLRVPRTLIGLMVGAALALAGTVLQGITRNPIADPGILGISQGASVAVVDLAVRSRAGHRHRRPERLRQVHHPAGARPAC
ncbi:Vitamin B12 import system permease protein BtuC [Streptomyces microflavus]